MAKDGGGTQGFGRVSTHTRPSPYSPLQFRGSLPTIQREAPAVPERRGSVTRGRRMAFAAVAVVMIVAGVGFAVLFRPTPLPVPRASAVPAPAAIPGAGDQGQRLAPLPVAKQRS
jgi:hypothetical protein